jgi:Sec-independent protein translocase protein TatA
MIELGSLGEIFIILIAALVLIGPREMPQLLHTLGRWSQKIQTLSVSLRQGLDHYIQEGKFEEYQKSINQEKLQQSTEQDQHREMRSSSSEQDHEHV